MYVCVFGASGLCLRFYRTSLPSGSAKRAWTEAPVSHYPVRLVFRLTISPNAANDGTRRENQDAIAVLPPSL